VLAWRNSRIGLATWNPEQFEGMQMLPVGSAPEPVPFRPGCGSLEGGIVNCIDAAATPPPKEIERHDRDTH
jgi:hypothetical protein